ncbi:MAG: GNAT family N-acetyltransferase [Tannerella sp.]|nr:GNAT family N-acetyltransferase [Tannerella sp.]
MSAKEAYRKLCQTEESIPVFSRDWWLDTVCGTENWEVILIWEKNTIQAAFPYYLLRPHLISMPFYTQTMGIWFPPFSDDTKYISVQEHRQSLCNQIIEQLKPYKSFWQNFHYEFTDWLPFYWNNYLQTTRYTYLLKSLDHPDRMWENMSQHTRRNIKKAVEKFHITVKQGIPIGEFMRVYAQTFERQNKKNTQDTKVLQRLIEVCRERKQGDLWGGYDPQGQLHAAVFIVWQKQSAYYLAGGGNQALRNSGAHSLVLWEAIQYAAGYSDVFDLEGSMIPGVERFFREFGGIQTPYFSIQKGKPSLFDRIIIKLNKYFSSKS